MTIRSAQSVRLIACAVVAASFAGATALAQTTPAAAAAPAPATAVPATGQAPRIAPAVEKILLTAGRSTVLATDFAVTRIAVTNPAVADAVVVQPREILIDGRSAGTVSLIVWGTTERRQYDLVVDPGVSALEQKLQELFPGEEIHVSANEESIILSGRASSNNVALRAAEIAAATSSQAKVVNLLQLPGGDASQQVLLQVRFAEVTRTAALEIGASLFTGPTGVNNTLGRITTGQFAAPGFQNLKWTNANGDFGSNVTSASGEFTFSDFLNLFVFSEKFNLGAVIRALQSKGLLQSLAEPNLIAYNGQPASFLAGGEIPIPVVQGGVGVNSVSVVFKEFGIRLNFTPTIAGDTIRLKVRPEVSSLDYNNAIVLSGFRIPAISTRRAETDVELRDGQSFAIAGLLDNLAQDTTTAVPVLARLPIIGNLFKSKATNAARTELMVLITPRLVRPLNPDEVPSLPSMPTKFLPGDENIGEQLEGGGGLIDAPPMPAGTSKTKNQKRDKRDRERP